MHASMKAKGDTVWNKTERNVVEYSNKKDCWQEGVKMGELVVVRGGESSGLGERERNGRVSERQWSKRRRK